MSTSIVWFRNDLRLNDNPALEQATNNSDKVIALYIYDDTDDNPWPLGGAQRWWLHHSLKALDESLNKKLVLKKGACLDVLRKLIEEHDVSSVYWNRYYEPYTIERDKKIKKALNDHNIDCQSFASYLLTEPSKITNKQGEPYKVFTPFWRHVLSFLDPDAPLPKPKNLSLKHIESDSLTDWSLLPKLDWADEFAQHWQPGEEGAHDKLEQFLDDGLSRYYKGRDFPGEPNTSKLSPHLHFGEISPRTIWHTAKCASDQGSINQKCIDTFLSQLGWREFSYHLLHQFPKLPTDNFRDQFDQFKWDKDDDALKAWQKGQTGYPIVDAGMRELWQTGTMHNRVRMIVGSFLIKDLFIHWREGEAWFWDTLLDADLANNAASWQWVAGCGADAAPYFRIFNPVLQGKKFDPKGEYVLKFVPELKGLDEKYLHCPWEAPHPPKDYPKPMVDHAKARNEALARYDQIKADN